MATLSVALVLMLLVVNWSFQRGFVAYIQQSEVEQITELADSLGQEYNRQGSWDFIRANQGRWPHILESTGLIAPPPPGLAPGSQLRPPGPPEQGPAEFKRPEDGHPAPARADRPAASVPLAHRISLLDVDRKPLAGPRISPGNTHWIPIGAEGAAVGWLSLQPIDVLSDQLARSFINQQRDSFVWVALSVLLISVLVATILARWFLRPIHLVVQGAQQLSAGDYEARVAVKGQDELAGLALSFNQMATVLQRNEQLRRQWVADISHELRTPLAVLSGEIEALQDGIRKPTRQRIASLYNDIRALSRLVEDLHQLSLADHGTMELMLTEVDLYNVVQLVRGSFDHRMQEHGLKLTLMANPSQNLWVIGDERRLVQLISNLLENSLRYTDAGGEVQLKLSTTGSMLNLQVCDSTPGVPESELSKIFERLYRVDQSRSRAVGGSGLGLTICKYIVEAHAGQILAENRPQGGLSIQVQLPQSNRIKR
uniref:ATP-binding protein n=1 Tax=Marinobacterium profundum TaxID=1714300 RepID=UPI0013150DF6|nr:ATP-binding protein [Marinobacterium profundum]